MFKTLRDFSIKHNYTTPVPDGCTEENLVDLLNGNWEKYKDDPVYWLYIGVYFATIKENIYESFVWYKRSAENGDPMAMHNTGYYFIAKEKKISVGIEWYKKAVKKGLTHAMVKLANHYDNSACVDSYDLSESFRWRKMAADHGDIREMVNLVRCYLVNNHPPNFNGLKYAERIFSEGDHSTKSSVISVFEDLKQTEDIVIEIYKRNMDQKIRECCNILTYETYRHCDPIITI